MDAFACLVSVKETFVVDGKLKNEDVARVWHRYDYTMHEWMLKLTEKFDLTFTIQEHNMSIVPCLLPEIEPAYNWAVIDEKNPIKIKEFKVVYSFSYIPNGLFNRIQVRLYQYADNSIIWKMGSFLRKNNHIALLQFKRRKAIIEVKVQGTKPENIMFLIHEVIVALINESFNGIKYDFSFPCPECVESQVIDPALFSSSLIRRAHELKAPFVQCQKFFHVISIQEMLSMMPIEGLTNIDMNLEYSLRDLKKLKSDTKYDIAFWYCQSDVPADGVSGKDSISPLKVIEAIKQQNYNIWYPKAAKDFKMDKVTYAIKESKMVILGISDSFAQDDQCLQVFELVKNIIKKSYLIVEFGKLGTHKWLENSTFASVCCDVRVIMQDPKRYSPKMVEVVDSIERQIKDTKTDKNMNQKPPDVFISYCWQNSHDAISKGTKATPTSLGWLDPRLLVEFFEKNGIETWLDISDMSSSSNGIFGEITKGLNKAKVVIACLSDEYVSSKNCALEFRFAHISLKLPMVKAIVGLGDEWKQNEIAFLAGSYPEVNFQYENKGNLR